MIHLTWLFSFFSCLPSLVICELNKSCAPTELSVNNISLILKLNKTNWPICSHSDLRAVTTGSKKYILLLSEMCLNFVCYSSSKQY